MKPRTLIAAAALALGSLTTLVSTQGALAAYVVCRTDPTVTLSNGDTLTLWADIADAPSDVHHVSYVLHLPLGVTVTSTAYDAYGYLESIQVLPDGKNKTVKIDTTVQTGSPVDVAAHAQKNHETFSWTAHGKSGTTLSVSFKY